MKGNDWARRDNGWADRLEERNLQNSALDPHDRHLIWCLPAFTVAVWDRHCLWCRLLIGISAQVLERQHRDGIRGQGGRGALPPAGSAP